MLTFLAIDIFQDVGKELKRRRILDFEEHFGCRVDETLIDNDPADNDSELKTTLEQRRKEGLQKFDEVSNLLYYIYEYFIRRPSVSTFGYALMTSGQT